MGRLFAWLPLILVIALAVDRCVPVTDLLRFASKSSSESCRIKGNISINGERIYHVPGTEWYDETRIDRVKGEKWFCSEEEALAAGWRKAYK